MAVRRKHAGDTKVGLPLLITDGKKRWEKFHYDYTTLGKYKPKPKAGTYPLKLKSPNAYPALEKKFKYHLPRNFCPCCDRTDRPTGPEAGGAPNMMTVTDPLPGTGLTPDDIMIGYKCQDCIIDAFYGKKTLTFVAAGGRDLTEYELKQLANERMRRNAMEYLRSALTRGSGYEKIFDDD